MAPTRPQRKRQTQLSFMPTSSPASSNLPEAVRERAAFVSIDDSPSPRKKQKTDVEMLPTPRPSLEGNRRVVSSSPLARRRTRFFVGGIASSPAIVSSSRFKKSSRVLDVSDSDDPLTTVEPRSPTPKSTKRTAIVDPDSDEPVVVRQASKAHGIVTFDDSESDEPTMRSSPMKRKRSSQPSTIKIDSSDEDGEPRNRSKKLRRSYRKPTKQRQESPFVVDDDQEDESLHTTSDAEVTDANVDDEEDEEATPARRVRYHHSSPQMAAEKAELDSDLEFLGDAQIDILPTSRTKKQSRQNMLDKLKAARAKKQGGGRPSRVVVDDIDDPEATNGSEDGTEDHEEPGEVVADQDWLYEREERENAFIDDDGAAEDERVALPFQFSNYSTMKPLELFKFVVEWMVQKKINPAFAITDEVYEIAFRRLDDYVAGMGNSKFQSSAWTPSFSVSIRGRPKLEAAYVGANLLYDRCDACNRSAHPATFEVYFRGSTYDRDTLEELEDDEDDSDNADEVDPEVPKAGTLYRVGKICMRNAKQAHAFRHWKFHLNEWIVDYLKDKGELTPDKIVARDSWKTKKRRKDAERIVDKMEGEGEIKSLRRDFKNEINVAQNVNNVGFNHP